MSSRWLVLVVVVGSMVAACFDGGGMQMTRDFEKFQDRKSD